MKIKKLILENINSLYGKWEIDFDAPEFRQSGIFAVTGKTGSGKSTILDAMCLALYGTTPRLNKSSAEAVSKGCCECLCELTFLDTSGREWISTFAYEKVRQGGNKGKMKDKPLHRLSCNGRTEAENTTSVRKMVEDITGMDPIRFCRAVLLAQGSFDAFLNAGNDNGEILERITGTEIYSRIAAKLKERYDCEKNKLALIEAQFDGIRMMPEEEVRETEKQTEALGAELAGCTAEQNRLNGLLQKYQQMELHKKNLLHYDEAEKLLSEEERLFAPSRLRLEEGKRVLDADEKFRPYKELQIQQAREEIALGQNEQRLLEQVKHREESREKLAAAVLAAETYQKEFELLNQTLTKVRSLDTVIHGLTGSVASAGEKRAAEIRGALQLRRDLALNRARLRSLEKNYSEAASYLESHPRDGELPAVQKICLDKLEYIKKRSRELTEAAQKKAVFLREAAALQKKQQAQEERLQEETEKMERISSGKMQAEEQLSRLLEGSTREHWEKLYAKQEQCCRQALLLRSLEEHRQQLRDGEPCPLCGAKEHPFALENMPEVEKENRELDALKKRLSRISEAEKQLQQIRGELENISNEKLRSQGGLELLKLQADVKQQEILSQKQAADQLEEELRKAEQQMDEILLPCGLSWDKEKFLLSAELTERINDFAACRSASALFEQQRQELQEEALRLQSALKFQREHCRRFRAEWMAQREIWQNTVRKRQELFGSKDPGKESLEAEKKRNSLASDTENARCTFAEINANCARTEEEISRLKKSISERHEELFHAQQNFLDACSAAGVTEEVFYASVLEKEELARLSARDADLKGRRSQLTENRKNSEKAAAELEAFLKDQQSREALAVLVEEAAVRIQERNQTLGALKEKLRQHEEGKRRMADQHAKLLEQQNVMALWTKMYDLIGVKDKFQRFAQGITLEHLLVLANIELEKFNGRYRLLRSRKEELGIDVADKDQGDEIRSCKTLSGGERFLISLALALGLSRMAGEKIRVDSLFLDEGFGTLDAETLDTALEALSNLRNRGKLVGVISHVAAFSEKIPCMIEVSKSGGGRSTLRGPGVRSL